MGLLIVSSQGANNPDGAILPFVTATMAKVSRIDVQVFLLGEATLLITRKYIDEVKGEIFEELKKAVENAVKEGIKIFVCSRYVKFYGLSKEDFTVDVTISSLSRLAELAAENNTLSF